MLQGVALVVLTEINKGWVRAQSRAHEGLFWWTDSDGLLTSLMVVAVVLAVIPAAFGFAPPSRSRLAPDHILIRWRWGLLAAALTVPLALDGLAYAYGLTGGFANAEGAAWMRGRSIEAQQPWSAATELEVGCRGEARRGDVLRYVVHFAEGRRARFSIRSSRTTELPSWLADAAAIDRRLRVLPQARQATFYTGNVDPRCLHSFRERLDPEATANLNRLLARTPTP